MLSKKVILFVGVYFMSIFKFQCVYSQFQCYSCSQARNDAVCNKQTVNCETPANESSRCITKLDSSLLEKRCATIDECTPNERLKLGEVMHQCCNQSLCNYKSRWNISELDILWDSVGSDPEIFINTVLIYQIMLLIFYITAVTYIIYNTPRNVKLKPKEDERAEDDDDDDAEMVPGS